VALAVAQSAISSRSTVHQHEFDLGFMDRQRRRTEALLGTRW